MQCSLTLKNTCTPYLENPVKGYQVLDIHVMLYNQSPDILLLHSLLAAYNEFVFPASLRTEIHE